VLPIVWLVLAVVVAVVLTMWVTFTLTRLDRLHARVDAAQAAMDAQLVRRAAALLHAAESPDSRAPDDRRAHYDAIAQKALNAGDADIERQTIENAVGRAVAELADLPDPLRPDAADELREAAARVLIARRFYNDAVRDTRALRARRMPRLFRMAGHRAMPQFFDIDDTLPAAPVAAVPDTAFDTASGAPSPSRETMEEDQT
jgi:hypothetical protein